MGPPPTVELVFGWTTCAIMGVIVGMVMVLAPTLVGRQVWYEYVY
jgi:hypothetical protein